MGPEEESCELDQCRTIEIDKSKMLKCAMEIIIYQTFMKSFKRWWLRFQCDIGNGRLVNSST